MPSSPAPSPSNGTNPLPTIFHTVSHGFWAAVTSSPFTALLFAVLALGIAIRIFRVLRWLPLTAAPRDSVRRFSPADRALIMRHAGGRCEHASLGGRCRVTENLQADHVHPHSRGGSTFVGNGQALCSRHNKQKAARIPFNWQLRALEKRRRSYFPEGASGAVVRRHP